MADEKLIKKLRLIEPDKSLVAFAPAEVMDRLPEVHTQASRATYGFVLLFAPSQAALKERWPDVVPLLQPASVVWVAYPKKSSPLASDINRDVGWDPVFASGYGPVSQVAIDHTYSALRWRPEKDIKRKPGSVVKPPEQAS